MPGLRKAYVGSSDLEKRQAAAASEKAIDSSAVLRAYRDTGGYIDGKWHSQKSFAPRWSKTQAAGGGDASGSASNLGGASADLMKSQEDFITSRSADIDRDTQRGFQQGMSNMIASGLPGTTAVGGMQTGLTEAAVRAKAGVAADAQQRTDQLQFGYAGLAQQASEGAAGRATQMDIAQMGADTQMSLGQMGADTAATQAALSRPVVQQADTSRFESTIRGLEKEIAQLRKSVGGMSNQGAGTYLTGTAYSPVS